MPAPRDPVIVGLDAGTSVLKAVAYDLAGREVGEASRPNRHDSGPDGRATQPLDRTWSDCAGVLRALGERVAGLRARAVALGVTGQGDGCWLVDRDGRPVGDGWLWLDARAGATAEALRARDGDGERFRITGTGLTACQCGTQLAHMEATAPELLDRAATAFHCKDWLYLRLTGIRATDPSEGCSTFGDFRTRAYDDRVIDALGLARRRHLLPDMIDGAATTDPLTAEAAAATGLLAGLPVSLGYLDAVCTVLGAGAWQPGRDVGCTVVGTTGVHVRVRAVDDVVLDPAARSGYVLALPVPGAVAQMQTNMAGTLNLDWVLGVVRDAARAFGATVDDAALHAQAGRWIEVAAPGRALFQPYVSEAGERGPFVDRHARGGYVGIGAGHGAADLVRATVEGIGFAARDCHEAMGGVPGEVRLTGGAARSAPLRAVLGAALGVPVRRSHRAEAGAAGAAMIAAVAVGAERDVAAAVEDWVVPHLGAAEPPDPALGEAYDRLHRAHLVARDALGPAWRALATAQARR